MVLLIVIFLIISGCSNGTVPMLSAETEDKTNFPIEQIHLFPKHEDGGTYFNPWPSPVERKRPATSFVAKLLFKHQLNLNSPKKSSFSSFPEIRNSEVGFTFIGHATYRIAWQDFVVLTDPFFSRRASPFSWFGPKRKVLPAVSMEEMGRVDVILISHNHYDHLDELSVSYWGNKALFVVPLGLKKWFNERGITKVIELDWGKQVKIGDAKITALPLMHWSKRKWSDDRESLWAAYVIQKNGRSIYFAGDTGYGPLFKLASELFPSIDAAILPIGGYEPRDVLGQNHINPEEAVQALLDLNAKIGLGNHWGTIQLTEEPMDEPPIRLAEAVSKAGLPKERFLVLQTGESYLLTDNNVVSHK
ncbi:MAG: MBL fold metallo-hydrolase [Nitrospirae bacterium]|nr:MBL fold metallo-hydrolase [Nitrospirota bacterium]